MSDQKNEACACDFGDVPSWGCPVHWREAHPALKPATPSSHEQVGMSAGKAMHLAHVIRTTKPASESSEEARDRMANVEANAFNWRGVVNKLRNSRFAFKLGYRAGWDAALRWERKKGE